MTVSSASSSDLPVRISREGDRTVVWLDGEHDIATAEVLAGALAEAIATDHADVVVDLSGVELLGAVTIHLLRRSRALLRHRGRTMTLQFPSKCARRVLALCGLPLQDLPIPHPSAHNGHARSATRAGMSPTMGGGVRSGG